MNSEKHINIEIPILARVEGEGALELAINEGKITKLNLRIFEPPRFFEKLLEGRPYSDVLDIVARICGICPVAYQMSAVQALEHIFNVDPGAWVRKMRRLMYCGEWIESHALHIHLLAAPDFLGFDNVVDMAKKFPGEVKRGLHLQFLGNRLLSLLGGRSVHPVGVCVGGFYHAPTVLEVNSLLSEFRQAVDEVRELVQWVCGFEMPEDSQQFPSVAMRHGREYPMNEGRIISDRGLDIDAEHFETRFREHQVAYSTALHCHLDGQPYLVGPLARLNLNVDCLPAECTQLLEKTGIQFPSSNMFHSIVARAIEMYLAILEAVKIMESYTLPDVANVRINPVAGTGYACTEAPRGLLWHRYELDENGAVKNAKIVPPTSQNQARIEQDIAGFLQARGLERNDVELQKFSERVIRNYDPCISCSTHFLNISVNRK